MLDARLRHMSALIRPHVRHSAGWTEYFPGWEPTRVWGLGRVLGCPSGTQSLALPGREGQDPDFPIGAPKAPVRGNRTMAGRSRAPQMPHLPPGQAPKGAPAGSWCPKKPLAGSWPATLGSDSSLRGGSQVNVAPFGSPTPPSQGGLHRGPAGGGVPRHATRWLGEE